jgi:hypothetical protein
VLMLPQLPRPLIPTVESTNRKKIKKKDSVRRTKESKKRELGKN